MISSYIMTNNIKNILVFIAILTQSIDFVTSCPTFCTCKWKNGKQTVECPKENLSNIPKGLDTGTQVLGLTHNNLQILTNECFENLGLINLQKLFLPYCRLSKIQKDAFKGLSNLVELDLSHNFIMSVPSNTFNHYPSLMRLCLNENPISRIKRHAFHPFKLLTSLEMSNCDIEFIEIEAFVGLVSLEWLKIDNNKITNVKGPYIFPDSLHGIDLQNNLWNCDCELLDLHNWLVNFNVPNPLEPACEFPERLKGSYIKKVKESDFACMPEVSPTSFYVELNEYDNVSLHCFVNATPQAHITWWYQGQILLNNTFIEPGFHVYFYKEEGTYNKNSELNIINVSSRDNGTFECIATNPAGKNQANFTIRVIIKKEPEYKPPIYSFRYKSLIICLSIILVIIFFLVILVSILKCKRVKEQRSRGNDNKEISFQEGDNSSKASTLNSFISVIPPKVRENILSSYQNDNISLCPTATNRQVSMINFDRTIYFSPTVGSSNIENNPDLISDAETMVKGNKCFNFYENINTPRYQNWQSRNDNRAIMTVRKPLHNMQLKDQQVYLSTIATLPRQHSNIEHRNKVNRTTIDGNGYPNDYGLPKLPLMHQNLSQIQNIPTVSTYSTLPYKKAKTKCDWNGQGMLARTIEETVPGISSPLNFSSNELTHTTKQNPRYQTLNQNNESNDITNNPMLEEFIPSPPEGYKSDITSAVSQNNGPLLAPRHCVNCSSELNKNKAVVNTSASMSHSQGNCGTNRNEVNYEANRLCLQHIKKTKILEQCSESPDEGYVGDNTDNVGS